MVFPTPGAAKVDRPLGRRRRAGGPTHGDGAGAWASFGMSPPLWLPESEKNTHLASPRASMLVVNSRPIVLRLSVGELMVRRVSRARRRVGELRAGKAKIARRSSRRERREGH